MLPVPAGAGGFGGAESGAAVLATAGFPSGDTGAAYECPVTLPTS